MMVMVQVDRQGQTPLYIACDSGCLEIVQCLIHAAADVNQNNHKGDTPLLIAAQQSHLMVVRCLLDAGADDARANSQGQAQHRILYFER